MAVRKRQKKTKPETVCDQLRAVIVECRLTPYRVAKLAGIKPEIVGRFLRVERDIYAETFAKIATALGLELTAKQQD